MYDLYPNLPTDDEAMGDMALQEMMAIAFDVSAHPKYRLRALARVLQYTHPLPVNRSRLTIDSALGWLESVVAEADRCRSPKPA